MCIRDSVSTDVSFPKSVGASSLKMLHSETLLLLLTVSASGCHAISSDPFVVVLDFGLEFGFEGGTSLALLVLDRWLL